MNQGLSLINIAINIEHGTGQKNKEGKKDIKNNNQYFW